jgi:hypothetical protein
LLHQHFQLVKLRVAGYKVARQWRLLTPKFGKGPDLWVQRGEESARKKEGFFRRIRQKSPRSTICFRSARELLRWFCGIAWRRGPSGKGRMDG